MKGNIALKKQMGLILGFIIFIVILGFLDRIVDFIINIQWYKEVGYLTVYFTRLIAIVELLVPIFFITYICIWIYYKSLKKSIIKWKKVIEVDAKRQKIEAKIFIGLNIVVSFIMAYSSASNYWYKILQFSNNTNFNIKDPIFNNDVSFYIFKLPLIESVYSLLMSLLLFLITVTVIVYFLLNLKDLNKYKNSKNPITNINYIKNGITKFAGKQLAIVSSLILLVLALGYMIDCWQLVYSSRGIVFGASYTDINVTLILYKIIVVTCVIASIIIFVSVLKSKAKPIVVSVVFIVILIISENIISLGVQNLVVKSNEKSFEAKYIKYNIEYTRKGFNIEDMQIKSFALDNNLTREGIDRNKQTIDNIKINSFKPALEFYNQVQVIRNYYDFNDIDVDRYNINGKYNQVFLAPRELDQKALEGNADTWQNTHLIYTHGYGAVMSKVNSVTSEGQPDFVIKDIPPENKTDIKLNNPRLYFGEKTNDYAIVDTKMQEFDYPQGGENKANNYDGKAGINATMMNKILFSINKKDANFLLSRDITSNSKILINRNIVDRVNKIAPFLTYDKDPYVVISNGKMYWIIDAYTTSDRFPYSQPEKNVNYMRNSVKVIIDSVDGTTNFYIVDKKDPIVNTYSRIFKGLFKDENEIPKDLKDHFRYPEDLFNIQCNVLGKYHVTDSGVFYNGDDLWEVSKNQKEIEGQKVINDSSYMIMKLPDEKKEEMILLEYFNMRGKDNMVALFGARMDGENYGKMVLYKLPTQKTIYSPYLFKQKLNQDPNISKEVSLWNTQGSQVQFGDTSIVPIDNSLLYIEPLYLRAQGKNSIPEVKRIIVAFADKIVIAENIENALKQLFDYDLPKTTVDKTEQNKNNQPSNNTNSSEKIKEAQDLYNKAIEAQKSGDWSKYGEYINSLGKALEQLYK